MKSTERPLRRMAALLLLAALLLGLGGCAARADGGPYSVYLIVKSTETEFWKSVFAGANAAKSTYNVELTVLGPETEEDYALQNGLRSGCCPLIPALLTRMSRPPNRFAVSATSRSSSA